MEMDFTCSLRKPSLNSVTWLSPCTTLLCTMYSFTCFSISAFLAVLKMQNRNLQVHVHSSCTSPTIKLEALFPIIQNLHAYKHISEERILKYWFKIVKSEGSLINKLFKYQIENNNNNNAMWADQVKNLLSELGFSYLWQNNNITELRLKCIIQRLYD